MVKAGHTSTVEVLKFLRAFEDETDYNVWSSISNILSRLSQLLGNTPYREGYDNVRQGKFYIILMRATSVSFSIRNSC